jgi:SAM-dependent methyltransferase
MAANRAKARYFADLLNEHGGVSGKTILDLGSGKGFFLRACLDRGAAHVAGLEFRAADMRHAREQEGVQDIRAAEIDRADVWPDAEFDAACSFDVLEHVHDLGKFLANAIRVTRGGGYFFHATPGYDSLSHRIGRGLLRLRIRKLGTVLANVRGVEEFSGGTHVAILGKEQVAWIGKRHRLEQVIVSYVPSYSYSDRHYAEVVPLLNRLPRPVGSLLFKLVRRANRNKLVWLSRVH